MRVTQFTVVLLGTTSARETAIYRQLLAAVSALLLFATACGDAREATTATAAATAPAATDPPVATQPPTASAPPATTEPAVSTTPVRSSTTTTAPVFDPKLAEDVDVSMTCERGNLLTELPFGYEALRLLDLRPVETAWIFQSVTITNNSDRSLQVAGGFAVTYLAADGSMLGEVPYVEPFPPALWVRPGQTAQRGTYTFHGVNKPVPDIILADRLYEELESCEVVGEISAAAVPASHFIESDFAGAVEVVSCGLNDQGDRFEGRFRVTNPRDETSLIDLAFEILDGDGTRIGLGGNEGDRIQQSSQADVTGWAGVQTVATPEAAQECVLLTLSTR